MSKYIDKDALVAEIEKRIKEAESNCGGCKSYDEHRCNLCTVGFYKEFLEIINTFEAKEVDLEKEIDKWWCSQFTDYSMVRVPNHKFVPKPEYIDPNFKQSETGKTKIGYKLCVDWKIDSDAIEWNPDAIRNFAKYFYELGLKTQKRE